jgi:hypothetical protein
MARKSIFNKNLFKAQMVEKNLKKKALAKALHWDSATAHKKINGKKAFTAPEIKAFIDFTCIEPFMVEQIFFTEQVS